MAVFRTRSRAACAATLTLAAAVAETPARAEAAACLSPDPAQWPAGSKPYFMLLVDTSGSMISPVAGAAPSCSGYSPTRMGHAKCAVKNTTLAFGGEVEFGLAQYASFMTGCSANCYGNTGGAPFPACAVQCFNAEVATTGLCSACGPMDDVNDPTTRRGASILVGMQIDNVWNSPPGAPMPSNLAALLAYVDDTCTGNTELSNPPVDGYPTGQYGKTPISGALRDMFRYFGAGWTHPDSPAITFPTPLSPLDRSCRSVNVILMTDGDETCDSQTDAVNAAASLFAGVTVGPNKFKIKTHVINFAGGSQSNTDAIAAAGGTIASYFATSEVQLSQALASIVAGAIKPETCDNLDNDCNGCTDEGFTHYCNVQPAPASCCAWATAPQRTACLNGFSASITAANPQGNRALLPCTTAAQVQPTTWLCHDPGEKCDGVDNNCVAGVDEGITKCGSPLHCPQPEACNGQDDDCNGLIDEGGVCPNACAPSAETCDGCDNDCDGVADDGVAPIPCGLPPSATVPGWCAGTITCKAPQSVPVGACAPGGGFNACNNTPHVEVCDGKDDDCNGLLDDGIPSIPCVPPGAPAGLDYGPTSGCKRGATTCTSGTTACVGWVGPSGEICDGLDNDCDGTIDDGVPGAGLPCGVDQLPCTPGLTACVNGTLVCQGGNPPTAEVCNGLDDDCDGLIDEGPLADAPGPGLGGCWALPGTCCTFQGLSWCPPPGATCTDNGSLAHPCNRGSLACSGAAGWMCQNPRSPVAETCNGLDDDCNGLVDDGKLPDAGAPCGSDVGECQQGALACMTGVLDCVGNVPPSPEVCDGKDNDCDGAIDDGIPAGAACTVAYDPALYPGPRNALPCQPGVLRCDGMGGQVCSFGVGPSPEVCDGIDNDCDGLVDEIGAAPDGLDGTANPLPPPAAHLGDACGTTAGECKAGSFHCVNGLFACLGGKEATPETCDCKDNDCDGVVDNPGGPGGPPLCSTGKDCVKSSGGCQCAAPCATGEFPCPPGQKCATVTASQTGEPLPDAHCVTDPDAACGDCATQTTKDTSGKVLCAPAGTVLDDCITPPVCTCKGQNGCVDPCSGVTCPTGLVCASIGPSLGACAADTCDNNPCPGCGKVCHLGACVDATTGETATSTTSATSTTGSGGSDRAIWGLATGGGGCSCEVGVGLASRLPEGRLALLALALIVARRRAKRASAILAITSALGSAGCTTDAFCFARCEGSTTASSTDASGSGGAGGGLLATAAGTGGDCFPDCGTSATGPACAPTSGGVEICDGLDNDCNGAVDEGFDFTSGKTCGNCTTNCYATLINCDPTTITCAVPAQGPGTAPGTCVCGACATDYHDLDANGTCEYYCVPTANDDALCNDRDDDCDGVKDEDVDLCTSATDCGKCGNDCFVLHGSPACVHTGGGACDPSNTRCAIQKCDCNGPGDCWWDLDGSYATGCEYACDVTGGGVEICDGVDNDCDGKIDGADDLSGDAELGVGCTGSPNGECATAIHAGVTACVGAHVVCAGPDVLHPGEQPETCNGKDDDCDGVVDDDVTDAGGSCGTNNVFPCSLGTLQCQGGALVCIGAITPGVETCNGQDDDCDGAIDETGTLPPIDSAGACNVPEPPPAGATSPCVAGTKACQGGTIQCVGSIGPTGPIDTCGVDANCDGVLTGQPDLQTDVHHCGACGHDCFTGAVHASWTCSAGTCQFQGCQNGYHDNGAAPDVTAGDHQCGYACTFVSAQEACNGVDDDCDGQIDEAVTAPSPAQICGVSPSATAPECTSQVTIACVAGAWKCTFPAGVCSPSCAAAPEICDALDNDCDGVVNETTPNYGKPCASDDGLPPPGDGACRTTGTYVCAGPGAVACSAVKNSAAAGPELCDGVDNDCDGLVDEPFSNKGSNPTYFVKPAVTRIASSLWIYTFEASRPGATTITAGAGNGYRCKAFNAADPSCNDGTIPVAPAGVTIDRTPACSVPAKIPWYDVTPPEAEQTCKGLGGHLCTTPEWQGACTTNPPSGTTCAWGYGPRGAACASAFTAGTKYCNLGVSYDFDSATPGSQSGLLVTGSAALKGCAADWSGLLGNPAATSKIADLTGNLREITKGAAGVYPLMGGAFTTQTEAGAACSFSFYTVDQTFQLFDLGYRCCFSADPTL